MSRPLLSPDHQPPTEYKTEREEVVDFCRRRRVGDPITTIKEKADCYRCKASFVVPDWSNLAKVLYDHPRPRLKCCLCFQGPFCSLICTTKHIHKCLPDYEDSAPRETQPRWPMGTTDCDHCHSIVKISRTIARKQGERAYFFCSPRCCQVIAVRIGADWSDIAEENQDNDDDDGCDRIKVRCLGCGDVFRTTDANAEYCSPSCFVFNSDSEQTMEEEQEES